jgi:iron(III) transport system substrate-binding protein
MARYAGAITLAALLASGPAGAASPALIDAAKREGHVTWYTTLLVDEASGPLKAAFEKRYPGIEVELIRREGGVQLNAILDEAKAGAPHADVFITVDNHHTRIANEKVAHVGWVAIPPVLGLSNNIGLIRNAPHPNAAKFLIDFNLSEEGQTVLKNGNHIPSSEKVEAADVTLKRGFTVNYISPERGVAYTEKGLAVYNRVMR